MSYVLRYAGLLEESARECDAAFALDPADRRLRSCALTFLALGRYDRAEDFVRLDERSQWARGRHAFLLLYRGKNAEGLKALQELQGRDEPISIIQLFLEQRPAPEMDALERRMKQQMEGIRDSEPKYFIALNFSYARRTQVALQFLRLAVEHNFCAYPAMDREPFLAAVRKLPEYSAIRAAGMACQQRFLAHRAEVAK
jgi:hypothetical protein